MRRAWIYTAVMAVLAVAAAPGARVARAADPFANGKLPIPPAFKVSLILDRASYFLGENVLVHYRVENTGTEPFKISVGGDYRGSPRHLRYVVSATSVGGDGPAPTDPYPNPMCMGGLGGELEVKLGNAFEDSVPLMRYLHFAAEGEYVVRITHDLGWTSLKDGSSAGAATVKIKLVMPTEAEAARLVQTMLDQPRDRVPMTGHRRDDFPDLSVLRYPIYLPMLHKQAASIASGRPEPTEALEALAQMPDPAAATLLAKLADEASGEAKAKFAAALAEHLPRTRDELGGATTAPVAGPATREAAAEARRLATPMLASDNDEEIRNGAVLLLRAGTSADMPLIVAALDRLIPKTITERRTDDIFSQTRGTIFSVRHAARELMTRGASRPMDPKSPGEILLWLTRDSAATQPSEWAVPGAEKWLDHPIPFIRQSALEAMPTTPLPSATRVRLLALIEDGDMNVRIAAAGVAQNAKESACVPAMLRRLARSDSKWEIDAIGYALEQLGASLDAWKVIAGRLDGAKLMQTFMGRLTGVMKGFAGWGWNSNIPIDPPPTALKQKWTAWLNEHEAELRAGKRFAPGDVALPADLFPKNFAVDTPQGEWPPRKS
jgi:hypothetical protein